MSDVPEIPKRYSDRPQGKAKVEFVNDLRPIGIFGFIQAGDRMVPLSRSQVNRRRKRRKHRG